MAVIVDATPNPNALKFTSDKIIFQGTASVSVMPGDSSEHEIMNDLMNINGVDNVFGYQNFITVNKQPGAEWDELQQKVIDVIENHGF